MIRYAVCSIRTNQVLSLHPKLSAACRARERQHGAQGTWVCPVEVCDQHPDRLYAEGTCGCYEQHQLVGVWDAYDQWEDAQGLAPCAECGSPWGWHDGGACPALPPYPTDAELEIVANEDAYQAWAASMAEYTEL